MPLRFAIVRPSGGTSPYRSVGPLREVLRVSMGGILLVVATFCVGCGMDVLPDDDLVTGSLPAQPATLRLPEGAPPSGILPTDWSRAKMALDQALSSVEADISVPWENADTGAHGTATPIGALRGGGCRDFMIAVVDAKSGDRWVRGEACRTGSSTVLNHVRMLDRA